jgi:hypothetical protein
MTDRLASHAIAHAEDMPCPCHGKTEAQLAAPYAAFAFSLPLLAIVALILMAVFA